MFKNYLIHLKQIYFNDNEKIRLTFIYCFDNFFWLFNIEIFDFIDW